MNKTIAYPIIGCLLFVWLCPSAQTSAHQAPQELESTGFKLHTINANATFSSCAVMDVNHDGKLDVVSGGYWYEAPDWKIHWVRDVEIIRGRPDGYSHLEIDINNDGWTDLVHANFRSASLYWLEHPGEGLGEWKKNLIAEPGNMETARLYDIDGDGRLDVLPNGWEFAAWWEFIPARAGEAPEWIRHEIGEEGGGHGSGFGDLNGDGRGDFVGTRGWFEAPANPRTEKWIWHPEFELGRTSMPIVVADVDEDGDNDLIWCIGHDYGMYWLEQKMENGQRSWEKHLVDNSWSQGHSPLWVDLDNNGVKEFVNGKRYWSHDGKDPGATDPQVIYRYEFDKDSHTFKRYLIQVNGPAGVGLDPKAADLDGDGDLDLILPGRSGLFWYENQLNER